MSKKFVTPTRLMLTLLGLPGALAHAQATTSSPSVSSEPAKLDEIVVTAQRRSENLQGVPIAIAAFNANALEQRGIANVRDLGEAVPGLIVESFNGLISPFVRGVGTTSSVVAGREASVATYVDGVYFTRLSSAFFDLAGIDRIEVLKGPQGTLFGRNSTGGVIQIVTKDPSYKSELLGSVTYGSFNAIEGNVYATSKLAENIAMNISVSGKTSDGWGKNLVSGDRFNYEDNIIARSKLLIDASDTTRIILSGFYDASKNSFVSYLYPGTSSASLSGSGHIFTRDEIGYYNTAASADGGSRFHIWGLSSRIEQDLPFAKLVAISAYIDTREHTGGGFTSDKLIPGAINSLTTPSEQLTQELQLLSRAPGPIDWVIGYYYFNYKTAYTGTPTLTGPLYGPGLNILSEQLSVSNALYGQASYTIVPGLKVTAGIRYTSDITRAQGTFAVNSVPPTPLSNAAPGRVSLRRVTFRAGVDYTPVKRVLVYASFNRGYKTGAFNILPYTSGVPTRPEGIDAYEGGIKSEFFDRKLRLNGALFHYDIVNPQVNLSTPLGVLLSNAGGSRVDGGELDIEAIMAQNLHLRASLTYLDSKYTSYTNTPAVGIDNINGGFVALPAFNAAGQRTPLAPKATLNAGADYSVHTDLGLTTLSADVYYNDGFVYEPQGALRQRAYTLLNVQVKQDLFRGIAARVWGKNLTGQRYSVLGSAVTGPNFGGQFSPGAPRSYGVTVDFTF